MTERFNNRSESKKGSIEEDVVLALSGIADQLAHATMTLYSDGNVVGAEASLQVAESLFPYQEKIIEQNNLESLKGTAHALKEKISAFRRKLDEEKNGSSSA